ncbi:MAG: DNA primase, partial [Firmicutes bacterium]|nr:DNA primase [Bacillota bacterium]
MPNSLNHNFPAELAALPQWVCWRLEKDAKGERDTKVPYNPKSGGKASSTNPDTWTSLDFAARACELHRYSGLGFMFIKEAGIVGIDIDHCIVDGALNETAAEIFAKLPPTYIEVSPSGTGLHIFLRGAMPDGGSRNAKTGVEMYSHARYFTMTGKHYGDCPVVVAEDGGALAWIHEQFITQRKAPDKRAKRRAASQVLEDSEILEKARSAKNGAAFAALWEGRWEGEFGSQSEADLALCCKLAFWTGKDRERMDRLFRQSSLMREKWDTRHHASGATYGEETLDRALDTVV